MERIWDKAVKLFAAMGGAAAGLLGGWDPLIKVLAGDADVVDYIGLIGVTLVGCSCVYSLLRQTKAE